MPIVSRHVFCSHIGHTGKTTLCFQSTCTYAHEHPEQSVIVCDFTEEGDCTKRMFGGSDAAIKLDDELFGSMFNLIQSASSPTAKPGRLSNWLTGRSSVADFDIGDHAIQVHKYNPKIPENVFLVSSGAWEREEEQMSQEDRRIFSAKILHSLEKSGKEWKLFCDTDGDRRPSPYTLLAYSLCPLAIVPLHLSKADMDRTETMLHILDDLRVRQIIDTQVCQVVWNFVKVFRVGACESEGLPLPFTPSKVSVDILHACNERLASVAEKLPGLFVHAVDNVFVRNSTYVMRQLPDNVLKPSEELGEPFVHMVNTLSGKTRTFQSGKVTYTSKVDELQNATEAISVFCTQLG